MDYVIDKVDWYREVLKEDANSFLFAELAELLYEDEKFEELVNVCETCAEKQPHNIKGKLFLALGLFQLGHREKAEGLLLELREEIKCFSKLFWACSEIENERGNRKAAISLLKLGYAINPDDEDILNRIEEWDVSDVDVIDVVPKMVYVRTTRETDEQPEEPKIMATIEEAEESIKTPEVEPPPFMEFTKFAIKKLERKISELAEAKVQHSGKPTIFDEEIKENLKKYITLCLHS